MTVKPSLLLAAVLAANLSAAAQAHAQLIVDVRDQSGAPVPDAVVTLAAGTVLDRSGVVVTVDQRDELFGALVSLLRPGDAVQFANSDKVLHHVYSFAPFNPFDVLVRPGERTAAEKYASVGIAAVGCNVHDDMITYVYVTDRPFASKTGPNGIARIEGAPRGVTQLSVWHPNAKGEGHAQTFEADITGRPQTEVLRIALKPQPARRQARY